MELVTAVLTTEPDADARSVFAVAATEAEAIAERLLSTVGGLGGIGFAEVALRLAASEALHAADQRAGTCRALRDAAPDLVARAGYSRTLLEGQLPHPQSVLRARQLAIQWGIDRMDRGEAGGHR